MAGDKLERKKRGFWGTLVMYVGVVVIVLGAVLVSSLASELLKELMRR